ncbi:IDEAL domain-containing protein [Bacillus sp. B1-b2]|uniref:IDEAL domain-containing protein n=1 Tax=Bacillus sp. B1-b2 TaxID=2653201 RepID=UPI0012624E9F|nr:IDEAL domain-containing protein [Bacillus sp. B1-b2]KAB7665376.1 IDEAL domain-containing protein [Bacillus sp. B1-b2]
MNDKSYTEFTKLHANKNKGNETYVIDLYIEMLLSEIQWNIEKANLMSLIDKAIDEQDRESFTELSIEYKQLCKRFDN